MDLKGILSKKTQERMTTESIRKVLEEDLERLVWEMNFSLLSEQGLQECILWVDTAEVTEVSVRERKQDLFGKIKNLFRRIWKRGEAWKRSTGRLYKKHGCRKE